MPTMATRYNAQYWVYSKAAATTATAARLPGRGFSSARCSARKPHPVSRITRAYMRASVA